MRLRMTWLACVAGLVLVLAGCQRLHEERSWDLKSGESRMIDVTDAPRNDQKIEVKVAANEEVDVFVVLENEVQDFRSKDGNFKRGNALKVGKGVKSETIQATIPAGKKFGVIVSAGKTTNVKVTLDAR